MTMQGLAQPVFDTERLRVFRIDVKPNDIDGTRAIFIGFLKEEDCPYVVITATVHLDAPNIGHYLEMIHTHDFWRGGGCATQLWLGMEKHLGARVKADTITEDGRKLQEAVDRRR